MPITKKPFGTLPDGRAVTQYTMTNHAGASVSVIDFGGTVTNIIVPDRDGRLGDVALGFDTLDGYIADHGCMGDTIGRYGNRIGAGKFTLDGVAYQLNTNDGANHLHGGNEGFNRKIWAIEPIEGEEDAEAYIGVDDEDEAEAVFQLFKQQNADEYNFID